MIVRILWTWGMFGTRSNLGNGWPHRPARWGDRKHLELDNSADLPDVLERALLLARQRIGYIAQIETIRYGVIGALNTSERDQDWQWNVYVDQSNVRYTTFQPDAWYWGQRSRAPASNYAAYAPMPPSVALRSWLRGSVGGRKLYQYQRYNERRFFYLLSREGQENNPYFLTPGDGGGAHQYHQLEPLSISGWSDYVGGAGNVREVNLHYREGSAFIDNVLSYEYANVATTHRNFSLRQ